MKIVKDMSCVTPFGTSTVMQCVYVSSVALSELRCALPSIALAVGSLKNDMFSTGAFVYIN
jgi:hypothetical protein